jgi:hypothetical protein
MKVVIIAPLEATSCGLGKEVDDFGESRRETQGVKLNDRETKALHKSTSITRSG